jgi:hypothetical protein
VIICSRGAFALLYPCVHTTWTLNEGYGRRYVRGSKPKRYERSNVVALEQKLGRPLLPGMQALHHCDNPPCIQQEHLYEGTCVDNVCDMDGRGRRRSRGDALSLDVREEIRRQYVPYVVTQQMLAVEYGVSKGTINNVVRRVT